MSNISTEIVFGVLALLAVLCEIILGSNIKLNRYLFAAVLSFIAGATFYESLKLPVYVIVLLALGIGVMAFIYMSWRTSKKAINEENTVEK